MQLYRGILAVYDLSSREVASDKPIGLYNQKGRKRGGLKVEVETMALRLRLASIYESNWIEQRSHI